MSNPIVVYSKAQDWLKEVQIRVRKAHVLLPADDPSIEGPWYKPTKGPRYGFVDTTDETAHEIEVQHIKSVVLPDAIRKRVQRKRDPQPLLQACIEHFQTENQKDEQD